MSTFTGRSYADETDLARLIAFLPAARPAEWISDYPAPADLREILCRPELQANTRLWFDQRDQLIAYALVDAYNNFMFNYAPHASSLELEEAIMQWGLSCGELPLDTVCREDDASRLAWLTRHGFQPQSTRTLRFMRSLTTPLPEVQLPQGFTIRSATGFSVEALVALHRAAFGTEHMTLEERRAIMSGPDYLPEFDLIAVAPDDRLAGFCFCSISGEENAITGRREGRTDPIGVPPDFQKRGLARALIVTGLQLLLERGAEYAVLGTDGENVVMHAAARSAGFQLESARMWLTKPLAES